MALVAFAGPIANVVVAVAFAVVYRVMALVGVDSGFFLNLVALIVQLNILLAIFNLIPIPPLDGYNVVLAYLPPRQAVTIQHYAPYGMHRAAAPDLPAGQPAASAPRAGCSDDPGAHRCIGSGSSSPTCERASSRRRRPSCTGSCRSAAWPSSSRCRSRIVAMASTSPSGCSRERAGRPRPARRRAAPRCRQGPPDAPLAPGRRRAARGARPVAPATRLPAPIRPRGATHSISTCTTSRCRPMLAAGAGLAPRVGAFIRRRGRRRGRAAPAER